MILHYYLGPYWGGYFEGFWILGYTWAWVIMLLCHCWGWLRLPTESHIHIGYRKCFSILILICYEQVYVYTPLHCYAFAGWGKLGGGDFGDFWGRSDPSLSPCDMLYVMSWYNRLQTGSHIHIDIGCIQSFLALWYLICCCVWAYGTTLTLTLLRVTPVGLMMIFRILGEDLSPSDVDVFFSWLITSVSPFFRMIVYITRNI